MNFDFYVPVQLITEKNGVINNATKIASLGKKAFIVTSGTAAEKSGALSDVKAALKSQNIPYEVHGTVAQNPLVEDAYEAGKKAATFGAQFIIGIGGGSAIDACKAIAIYTANPQLDMLAVFDKNWKNLPLPIVAIGTTAGTGSEVNQISVLTRPDGRKASISDPRCFPALSFGDSKYTYTLPLNFTISTALDALSHALEGYFSSESTKISDLFALEAISVVYPIIKKLANYQNVSEITPEQRDALYYGSICAGFTLSRCGTAYCHPLGYFLSEEYNVPHGMACAVFLPGFIRRETLLVKDKSAALIRAIDDDPESMAQLIEILTTVVNIKITPEKAMEVARDKADSVNLKRTLPNGVAFEEALEILTNLLT